jgi:hypothetical protein
MSKQGQITLDILARLFDFLSSASGSVKFFVNSPFLKNYQRYPFETWIIVHYQKRNQYQQLLRKMRQKYLGRKEGWTEEKQYNPLPLRGAGV